MSVYDHSAYGAREEYRKDLRRDLIGGILAGLLAGLALLVVLFRYDLLWFRPLAAPEFVSAALLEGAVPGAETLARLRGARMAMFTTIHIVAFTFLGILMARFFRFTQLRKTYVTGALYGLVVCSVTLAAGMQVTGTQMSTKHGWPLFMACNFAAGIVMVLVLRRMQGIASS